jgi:hypothetical protein
MCKERLSAQPTKVYLRILNLPHLKYTYIVSASHITYISIASVVKYYIVSSNLKSIFSVRSSNTGHTQKNGAVLIVNTIKTAPFFCVCPVYAHIMSANHTKYKLGYNVMKRTEYIVSF